MIISFKVAEFLSQHTLLDRVGNGEYNYKLSDSALKELLIMVVEDNAPIKRSCQEPEYSSGVVVPWKLEDGRIINLVAEKDYKNVPDGTILIDIEGESHIKGRDKIDMDTRHGMLAYGVLKQ